MTDSEPSETREGRDIRHAAERLCTACGMCCNGVLFEIVRLQPQDSLRDLERLGMEIYRKKKEPYFKQPCRFLNGCSCTIYTARPTRCRHFECQQLKRLADGEITEADAMTKIIRAQSLVAKVLARLTELGDDAPQDSLDERTRRVLELHPDASLQTEVSALKTLLNREFRVAG